MCIGERAVQSVHLLPLLFASIIILCELLRLQGNEIKARVPHVSRRLAEGGLSKVRTPEFLPRSKLQPQLLLTSPPPPNRTTPEEMECDWVDGGANPQPSSR